MLRSLEIVGETLNNQVLMTAIEQTRVAIREGNKLSDPLAKSNLFPTMVTTMIDVGVAKNDEVEQQETQEIRHRCAGTTPLHDLIMF